MFNIDNTPRQLGPDGPNLFPIGFGCWRFAGVDISVARARIDAALEAGIELFDHADIYGSGAAEELFGSVLKEAPELRNQMFIASKGGIVKGRPYDSSSSYLISACEASLKRLNVDTIDLYQIHRPDLLTHPLEVAEAFVTLRNSGKIRFAGVSNFTPAQVDALIRWLPFSLASNQVEISPWKLECFQDGTLDQCQRLEIAPLAWSPLAKGVLGGEITTTDTLESRRLSALLSVMDSLALREGVDRLAISLAFLLAHPSGIIPIVGTQRVDRIRAVGQVFGISLTREDWYGLFVASQGFAMP